MSRLHGRLTALAVKHANVVGRYADGLGLYMQISPNGSRSWILRYRLNGRRRHLGLGPLPRVTLAEARELASAARQILRDGRDPIEVKGSRRAAAVLTAAKAMTFATAAQAYIAAHAAGMTPKSSAQWASSLGRFAYPAIGALSVADVDTAAVMKVLTPIWSTKTETASRIRARIEAILDWAKVAGHRDGENPARWAGHLENLLPAKSKVTKVVHHAALPYAELPAFVADLRQNPAIAARALEFAILTAARSGEVFGARWEEVDLATRTWTLLPARMKMRREHRVPLSSSAVELLGALPGPHMGLVFPGMKPGRPLGATAFQTILRRMGRSDVTVHGMRACFSTWAAECTAFTGELVELALAHVVGSRVVRAYRRGDMLERRVQLMAQWGDFCAGKAPVSAEVIELRRPA